MSVRMNHPTLPADQVIDVDPIAVPHHQAAGWQVEPGQDETGEEWPTELQRFEGQEQVRMRHPDLDAEIVVARSTVPAHQSNNWYQVEEDVPLPELPEAPDDLEALTVEDLRDLLRARDLPVSGTKTELVSRLRAAPAEEEPATPADQESEE
jgi:hypothetical protein